LLVAVPAVVSVDLVVAVSCAGTLAAYQWRVARADDPGLAPNFIEDVRRRWIASVIGERRDILAIQTLRNMLMAANFFASTAFFAAVGMLSFGMATEHVPTVFDRLNFGGSHDHTLFTGKFLLLVVLLFATFFNFALAIRYYNHVGLVLNVPPDDGHTMEDRAGGLLRRGALHYSWGMRGYYYVIPMALWLFGPLWMAAAGRSHQILRNPDRLRPGLREGPLA
jgi:uncharacterized membrane protein